MEEYVKINETEMKIVKTTTEEEIVTLDILKNEKTQIERTIADIASENEKQSKLWSEKWVSVNAKIAEAEKQGLVAEPIAVEPAEAEIVK